MARLERFRGHKDEYFRGDPHSPLLPEQQQRFQGLAYYPEAPDLRFEVALDSSHSAAPVELDTTTGEKRTLIPAGTVELPIEGRRVRLLVFREPGRGRYFLPFRDATAGQETYELGRYLDPQETPSGALIVDFNYAYNPYCAYNSGWTCPIPPVENHVPVPIRAGERDFGARPA